VSDVIVVGAGPTGLLLAGDLAEAGVDVTLLEQRGGDVSNLSRAFAVHARTLEVLDARGLVDELDRTGAGRLAGLRLFGRVRVDLGRLPSRFPYMLVTAQYNVERVLRERAVAAGVTTVHNTHVSGVRQDDTGASVDTQGPDGSTQSYRATYVVGADGYRSAVRDALGLPFPGKSVLKSIMLADVRLRDTPPETLTVNGTGDTMAFIAPFGDGWWRIFAWDRNRAVSDDTPLELEDVRAVTQRALGSDYGMHDPRWLSRFHSDERQSPRYRVGRVFLAGDAAHVHSPAGGMGMNTGLQDAANLSWKLAAVLRGAPESLLDSYQDERHPLGEQVLRLSGTLIRMAMLKPRRARAFRDVVVPLAVRIPAIHRRLIGRVSAVGFRYQAPHGEHDLVGTRMPDTPLVDGTRLYEALRGGRFVLLGDIKPEGWHDRVHVTAPVDGRVVLVRPDGYVAKVFPASADRAEVHAALRKLAGDP
jgi:2-polyprenyl-6-methoxyphenol hydroxylase-like FAD-dependent oxidoreductase